MPVALPLKLSCQSRPTMDVVQPMRGHFRSRKIVQVTDEIGVPIESESAFWVEIDMIYVLAQQRQGRDGTVFHQLYRAPIRRHEQRRSKVGMTIEKAFKATECSTSQVPACFVGIVRSRRMHIVDAEADSGDLAFR